ncbi:sigma-70 family RNA polymerase sigma factor [Luteibacter jiangsuensis]|nr:sigma-70 family RNA polymerase sigma factor [Luteibacter jiangsuensis]
MTPDPASKKVTPLGATRRVSHSANQAATDARYWAEQMAGVAARQDTDCFMRIYDYYAPRLLRYLLGLKVAAPQAEELVQEVMLRLWRRAGLFDPARASLSTWLFRVARNLSIDSRRGEPSWLESKRDLDWLDQLGCDDPASSAESFTDHAVIARAIDALPAVQARLIRMSYFEAKSHSEIANELGMPLGSVKSHLRRAFARLQAGLKGVQ